MLKSYAIAAFMTVSATAAAAQNTPAPATITPQAEAAEKKICKTERMTGSLTRSTRTCLTKSQWDRLAESTRKGLDDITANASRGGGQAAGMGTSSGPGL